jgi:hypothetical protein
MIYVSRFRSVGFEVCFLTSLGFVQASPGVRSFSLADIFVLPSIALDRNLRHFASNSFTLNGVPRPGEN